MRNPEIKQGETTPPVGEEFQQEHRSLVHLHKRNALAIFMVLGALILGILLLLTMHHGKNQTQARRALERHFAERVVHLDNLLKEVTTHLGSMRLVAESHLAETRTSRHFDFPTAFGSLRDNTGNDYFHLDSLTPETLTITTGNLTGAGSIANRPDDFYREISMALALNPLFRSARDTIKTAAWVYYLSKDNFINLYPWVPSSAYRATRETYQKELYQLGLPGKNPKRGPYWTGVYIDEAGKGLMTTCGIPVYDGNRFAGVIALDLTVDFLNSILKQFRPEKGRLFLVNDRSQLLAHPEITMSKHTTVKQLTDALPDSLKHQQERIAWLPSLKSRNVADQTIIRADLTHAPWQVLYIEPQPGLLAAFMASTGPNAFLLLAGLVGLTVIVLFATHFRYIVPTEKFLKFILERSRLGASDVDREVPAMWKPWFAMVDKTFAENEALTEQVQHHINELEQRVRQRTEALERLNAALRRESDEHKQTAGALKKQELRMSAILRASPVGIGLVINRQMNWANKTMYRLVGYEQDSLLGQNARVLYPDRAEYERVREALYCNVTKSKTGQVETRWVRRDGTVFDCLLRCCSLDLADPSRGQIVAVTDITDIKRLEAELQSAQKMEIIGTLAGGVAHDLNNILSGIVSYPELLLMDLPTDSPLRKPIKTIQKSGERAAIIVQDLLTMARRSIAINEVVDLNEIIMDQMYSPESDKLKIFHPEVKIFTRLARDLLPIKGSAVHLSKSVMNLVFNAAEAMPDGGEIRIATKNIYLDRPVKGYNHVDEGEYATVSISDTGTGISEEDRRRIFEPFYSRKILGRSGTGLGMTVVWGTVKDHKGYIDIHNAQNRGTTFLLYFPVTRETLAARESRKPDLAALRGGGQSVLVVDDVEEQREIAAGMLSKLGYAARTAASGEEAAALVEKNPVDILVLDMIMDPGMDGLDTYRRILARYPDQKAIIASGFSETDRVREAQKLGAGEYIRKPYTFEKIGMALLKELKT